MAEECGVSRVITLMLKCSNDYCRRSHPNDHYGSTNHRYQLCPNLPPVEMLNKKSATYSSRPHFTMACDLVGGSVRSTLTLRAQPHRTATVRRLGSASLLAPVFVFSLLDFSRCIDRSCPPVLFHSALSFCVLWLASHVYILRLLCLQNNSLLRSSEPRLISPHERRLVALYVPALYHRTPASGIHFVVFVYVFPLGRHLYNSHLTFRRISSFSSNQIHRQVQSCRRMLYGVIGTKPALRSFEIH